MKNARRSLPRMAMPVCAIAVALATARCGLLGAPGEYGGASGEGPSADATTETSSLTDAMSQPENVVLPDGMVVPSSIGTIAVLAGEREPTSADDNPAWSADAWSGVLAADGRVATWRIEKSAPIIGSFIAGGLIDKTWVMLNIGFGVGGGTGTAIQSTSWTPGITGDWKAGRANGSPGGLDNATRAFFGTRLAYVGGTRTNPGVDGGPATTFFTREVHFSDVDVVENTIGSSSDTGQQLVTARSRAGVATIGSYVYVVGGRGNGGILNAVEAAKVDLTTGVFEAFAAQPPLTASGGDHKLFEPALASTDDHLFVAGGRVDNANAPSEVVLSAKIAVDGSLSAFQTLTPLPEALRDFAMVAFKKTLYVIGGSNGTARSDVVYSAAISADGKIGTWQTNNAKLPSPRSDFVALAY